jgi:hypothetical protein
VIVFGSWRDHPFRFGVRLFFLKLVLGGALFSLGGGVRFCENSILCHPRSFIALRFGYLLGKDGSFVFRQLRCMIFFLHIGGRSQLGAFPVPFVFDFHFDFHVTDPRQLSQHRRQRCKRLRRRL